MHDLSWGVLIGLAATIPLSIVANILTPKVVNWWADRSEANTRKRIEQIEVTLAAFKEMSEAEEHILILAEGIVMMLGLVIVLACMVLMLVSSSTVGVHSEILLGARAFIWMAVPYDAVMVYAVLFYFRKFRGRRGPLARHYLRRDLERLKRRLSS
jgi:hypothetical protein